jgi:hypothetical protein
VTTTTTTIEQARTQLACYGYTLNAAYEITRGEKNLRVVVSVKGARIYARQQTGALLWSGPDIGWFVERFWFAKRVAGG